MTGPLSGEDRQIAARWLRGDIASVAAVFRNIVGNAIKFSRSGSTVEVVVEPAEDGN